ncbi:MAG TPA: DNA adenine methylase [Pelotomaculum sp.]|nr:DNA adenine methylase [Pelotomaculum sp.]
MNKRPFLKWAGGKYRIIERIKALLPEGDCLIEPFCGSCAVALNTGYDRYILADNNADLINLYQRLQVEVEDFIEYSRYFFYPSYNNEEYYYTFREEFNSDLVGYDKAALFLYLNRHGYNGLCRYNKHGKFNVPFGRHDQPYFPEAEMRHFHEKAKAAVFKVADFRDTMREAKLGSVIYCDPPYVPLSDTANFKDYSPGGFSLWDQGDLADLAKECAGRGIPVLISNHATKFTLAEYKGARIEQFDVRRNISCNGGNRGKAGELLVLFS